MIWKCDAEDAVEARRLLRLESRTSAHWRRCREHDDGGCHPRRGRGVGVTFSNRNGDFAKKEFAARLRRSLARARAQQVWLTRPVSVMKSKQIEKVGLSAAVPLSWRRKCCTRPKSRAKSKMYLANTTVAAPTPPPRRLLPVSSWRALGRGSQRLQSALTQKF